MSILTFVEAIGEMPAIESHPAAHRWIQAACDAVLTELGRSILLASDHEDLPVEGFGGSTLYLPEWPLSGTIVVKIDGTTQQASTYTVRGGSLTARPESRGRILRSSGCWPVGPDRITVSGTFGYTKIPHQIRQASLLDVRRSALRAGVNVAADGETPNNVKREKIRNEETEYFPSAELAGLASLAADPGTLPAAALALLLPFKRFDF